MPLLRPEAPAKKKAAIHVEVKRSKFAAWQHVRTWLSRPMTRLTLQQGDGSHCLARHRRPDAGADEEDVKPRPPWHAAPASPVKPRPPPHPQTAPFRATLPRHGRSQLHHDANSPRHGRSRLHRGASSPRQGRSQLHHGASNLTQGRSQLHHGASSPRQGRSRETQTTPASTNCPISSHTAETGAGPVTPWRKQP